MSALFDLTKQVSAVAPIHGIALLDRVAHTLRIDFNGANQSQIDAANNVAATFDWSDPAQGTRDAQRAKAAATAGIDRGELKEGLGIDRATVAVVFAALAEFNLHAAKLTELATTVNAILTAVDQGTNLADLKARVLLIADVTGYPQRTKTQLKNLVKSEIANTAE